MFDHSPFADLSPTREITLRRGEAVFRRGDPADRMFRVAEGGVRLERTLADGSFICLATASEGMTFAEAAVFSETYRCDAVALEDSRVIAYPLADLRRRLTGDLDLALALSRFFAEQVHALRTQLELRGVRSAEARLLGWLRLNASSDGHVLVETSWQTVAAQLALTPEAVYRALRTLQAKGAVRRRGRRGAQVLGAARDAIA